MKTITKTTIGDIEVLTIHDNDKSNLSLSEEITDIIMDSYNEQIHLGNQFKDKISRILSSMEFAYPNDKENIQQSVDEFLKASDNLMGEFMNNTLNLYVTVKPDLQVVYNESNTIDCVFSEIVATIENKQWMVDWLEQVSFLKNKTEDLKIDEHGNDFCYYVDVTEMVN
jgi:hypothetical protein